MTADVVALGRSKGPPRRPRQMPPLLALGARVRVGWRQGRVVGRSRDCPIRYDIAYDDGGAEIGVEAGRVLPAGDRGDA